MKNNIFFKAVPGLFQRRKKIKDDNQQYFYNNKLLESVNKLKVTNKEIVANVRELHSSTEYLQKVMNEISNHSQSSLKGVNQLHDKLHNLQSDQKERVEKQLQSLQESINYLKDTQETNQANVKNEHELLILLLEGLYERIESLQKEYETEIHSISNKMMIKQREAEEKSNILIDNDKANNNLLFKIREQHLEFEQNIINEQANFVEQLTELRKDMKSLQAILENDILQKN
ncbi:hypothetical protein ACERII_06800 [Evansella sp. AB-rgal1]|uniref:hypothetical protein n=1 Tax=Evansella sp. AB-rgal1 TaxID=3242696 RepID=UPI00359DD5EB